MTDNDHADEGRSARLRFAKVGRRHIFAVAGTALLISLLGLYRDAAFLSRFGIDYLEYLGRADIRPSAVNGFAMLADVRFLSAFAVAVGALMLLLVLLYALRIGIAAARHATSMGRPYVPVNDAIRETLAKHLSDQHSLGTHLCRYLLGPYRLGAVLSVAAFFAVNISTSAEQDDVELVASVLRASPLEKDAASLRRALLSDHRVVSVRTHDPPARFDNLIDLGSSQNYLFYYDAMAQEPVVLAKSNVAAKLADVAIDRAAWFELASRSAGSAEDDGVADSSDSEEAVATDALAWNDDPSASDTGMEVAAAETERADAGAKGHEPADAAHGDSKLAAIRANFEQSRDSLERLKEHISALQGRVSEAGSLIGRLDLTLADLDQLVADLADEAAPAGRPREHQSSVSTDVETTSYGECREVELAQPIRFGPERTSLDFEAIGVLFAARERFAATAEAADRQARLVIEGHDDTAGSTAHNLALSEERAEAVRDFLRAELGVPQEVLEVVALGGTGPEARFVRIYDCRDRPQRSASASGGGNLGLTRAAAASEMGKAPSAGDGAVEIDTEAADEELQVALADLEARESERGLVLTVPGDLLWETDSDQVRPPAEPRLAQLAGVLERYAPRRAVISGHTDAHGARDYNRQLSERRAQAVREHLIARYGIAGDRLLTRGMGEDEPIASNRTPQGRQANRRIEIQLLE